MAFCLNRVQLLGHVGKEPKFNQAKNGNEVAHFSLATSEGWTDKRSGEKMEKTEWHDIVVWSPALVRMCKERVKKGTRLFVEGKLETRKWTGQDGQERFRVEITVQQYGGQIFLMGNERSAPAQAEGDSGSWIAAPASAGFEGASTFDTASGFDAPAAKPDPTVPF